MPEYLEPGVYMAEEGYRSKSIPGVSTSTASFLVLGVLIGVGLALLIDKGRRRCSLKRGVTV